MKMTKDATSTLAEQSGVFVYMVGGNKLSCNLEAA